MEIVITDPKGELLEVALHAESVDRNTMCFFVTVGLDRRSPCGERG